MTLFIFVLLYCIAAICLTWKLDACKYLIDYKRLLCESIGMPYGLVYQQKIVSHNSDTATFYGGKPSDIIDTWEFYN